MEFDTDYFSIYAELNFYPLWWDLLEHAFVWQIYNDDNSVCMTTVSEILLGWVNVNVETGFYKCAYSLFENSVYGGPWYTCDWRYSSFDDLVDYTLWTFEPTFIDTCNPDVPEEAVVEEVPLEEEVTEVAE